ncbi:MAG: MFS transporter [Thermoplasmata archaeon]|jgi:EmrB/QacA subfamily drug resistance transporter
MHAASPPPRRSGADPTTEGALRSPATEPAHETAVLTLTTLGTLMVAVDSTIVILALPTMARDLAAPLETVIWTILVYLLITAALTTQAGRLGDMWGRGRVYNSGFALFTIGSAACGFAPTADVLIASRALQAIGGAIMFANSGALIASVFPPTRRGRAFGFMSFGWGVGAILGILLGGVITTELGWRYIFFINIPIGIVAVVLGWLTLPRTRPEPTHFDIPGFVLLSSSLALICYGAIETASYGVSTLNLLYVGLGLVLVPAFIGTELRTPRPMLELRQLRDRLLGFSLIAGFLQSLGYLSVVFLLTLYLQGLRGLSPLDASLLLVPGYLVGALSGPMLGRQVDILGSRALATGGILCMLAAVGGYSLLALDSWLGWIPIISVVSGFGTGMFYPANSTAIMARTSPGTFGSISGLRGTLSNLGTLLSFVLTLSIASATVPRAVAYRVFLGVGTLAGGVGADFLTGIHAALLGSAAILVVAAVLSWSRGPSPAHSAAATERVPPPRAAKRP